ncbi:MAG: DEAD/DEAH box helicase [Chloroflexi bacterium]|nr:DEAD/DEAH box helicase [Chloroflexota bacterium]
MNVDQVVEQLLRDSRHARNVTAYRHQEPREADFAPWPAALDGRLRAALEARGIHQLYRHQAEAFEHAQAGHGVCVVTPTASGKTLCYNLPVLNRVLQQPGARALYLFPTKALAQDQYAELLELIGVLGVDVKTHTFDGDTPAAARSKLRSAGDVIITNPDMLHTGILPHHPRWQRLFENLRYVVVDELHQYRGVFGSHLANVLRRLRRICRFYDADPQFICCSATIANPGELAERLTESPMAVVDRNGAPAAGRHLIFYNPPVVNPWLGIRAGAIPTARTIAANFLLNDLQTIVFARGRLNVEVLLTYLKERLRKAGRSPDLVQGYRSGYLPLQRRAIERSLRDGSLRGVVATNALELGIDVGGLEASVLCGYPGSIASTLQRIGRVGRRGSSSVAVLVATSSPLDQFIVTHPDYFFGQSPEQGLISPNHLAILAEHLRCAAFELPFPEQAPAFGNAAAVAECLAFLESERVVHLGGGRYHWMSEHYPAEAVSLRRADIHNFVIVDQGPPVRVLGEVDRAAAPLLVHEEAIYLHLGEQYQVERLDWENQKAYVRRVDVDYYTDASLAVAVRVLDVFDETRGETPKFQHGEVVVSATPTIYKKIKFDTRENVGWGKIHLPEEDMHTHAVWFVLPPEGARGLTPEAFPGALLGLANVLVQIAPLYLMCDPRDVRVVSEVRSIFTEGPTVTLYDNIPGGLELAPQLFSMRRELLEAAADLVAACPCPTGCPSCVGPLIEVGEQGKATVLSMLRHLTAPPRVPTRPA